MRTLSIAILGAAIALAGAGCSGSRVLPREALVERAWTGREPPTTQRALAVVAFANAQIGKPYCWGGMGPKCFDCSGLVGRAWSLVGTRVPRTTHDIADALPEVQPDEVRAGDILWWPGHVGIYIGHGWLVDALDSRHGVVRRPATDPYRAFRPASEIGFETRGEPGAG